MVRVKLPPWSGRVVAAVAAVVVLVVFGASWIASNQIRNDLLVPRPHQDGYDLEVLDIAGGRIVLPRTETSAKDGLWGVESAEAYGQAGAIVRIGEDDVERTITTLEGELSPGDRVRLDVDAYPGDPKSAHGIGFEDVRVPGERGPQPAWLIEGRRTTWFVFAHGSGVDRRSEALRLIPTLVEQGFPVVVATYRNDVAAPTSTDGLRRWGLEEWRDLEAAMVTAERKGAEDFVIVGHGLGAEVVAMLLHESDFSGRVRGVVLDSPVLDFEELARTTSSWPEPIGWLGRRLAAIRFGVEWSYLDQVARADEFDVPILILHGGDDLVAAYASSAAFAAALPGLVELVRVEQGGHTDLWNTDSPRYEDQVLESVARWVESE